MEELREEIAIIGMAGRFPGAANIEEFWRNVRDGIESIKTFTAEESIASGVHPDLFKNPKFVNRHGALEDADSFDATFFGISPKEAEMMDPQHRLFLECAWAAIESAGYDPERYAGQIGVFGGVARNTYFIHNMLAFRDLIHSGAFYETMLGSEKDFPATRVSYKMNLTGPSINVQTACSTSGVAIHLACQSLLNGECDMAIAGGGRVQVPLKGGYLFVEGGIASPDGHCRAFDENAHGTVYGSGVGMIILKRLSDADHDGDEIHAVIRGTAVNNDGSDKVGFTAPSIRGQSAVIQEALGVAGVDADTISYVEAHGTGTGVGDPIEIAGLTKAFRKSTDGNGYCAIGSVKTNIGHLDAGACVAGIIKTVLALKNRVIPPSLNFKRPNPMIDFANSPFYVVTEPKEWKSNGTPRRAGVSSFGLGGTNVHLILEEAPEIDPSGAGRLHQLLLLSAKTAAALEVATKNLANHLRQHPEGSLADVAYTLQLGRKPFGHRRTVVCQSHDDAITALESLDLKRVTTSHQEPIPRGVIFMFSGQGSQYVNMGLELYRNESIFRQEIDRCCDILQPFLSLDLRTILYPETDDFDGATKKLTQTSLTQPALFTVEYALAKLWMSWGVYPEAMVGHSIGEYVAACLAEAFSLEDALSLVAARGRLMQALPPGLMLAVPLSEKEVEPYLNDKISLATVNGPSLCVLSGEKQDIEEVEKELSHEHVDCIHLHTSHAFHSRMMDPMLDAFGAEVSRVTLRSPQTPFLSNVTGEWVTAAEATNPAYWVAHVRRTVRFNDCVQELLKQPNALLLEVGPGQVLTTLVRQHPKRTKTHMVLPSTRHPKEDTPDLAFILRSLGQLWHAGTPIDWVGYHATERRRRLPLPTYPFEHKSYWINGGQRERVCDPPAHELRIEPQESAVHLPMNTLQVPETRNEGTRRADVEQSLLDLWQELLGIDGITLRDNFFELGGSSLLAVRLFVQIEKKFGKTLSPSIIFQAPTVEQLAGILDQHVGPSSHTSLVLLQKGISKPPLFCLPGAMGNVFTDLGHLAKHLGPDQPVYGLQDGVHNPSGVKALAARYIAEMRTVKPKGPYILAGVCSGGTVAFEMAQQFQDQGQKVSLLALIEPARPFVSHWSVLTFTVGRFTRRLGHHSKTVSALSEAERKAYIQLRVKLIANMWGLSRYAPQPYSGSVHLFLTHQSLEPFHDFRLRWRKLVLGNIEVHEIPGTHDTITGNNDTKIEETHMKELASKLRICIDTTVNGKPAE